MSKNILVVVLPKLTFSSCKTSFDWSQIEPLANCLV